MQNNFSPSVNIVRDNTKVINYITTPNAKQIFNQLVNDFKTGIHVFNLIGSYGTGKSSFLWALQQSLQTTTSYFEGAKVAFGDFQTINFLSVVGGYKSLSDVFKEELQIKAESIAEILQAFDAYYQNQIAPNNGLLFIVIDEFGKHLEYAAKNQPEKELYFLQQLAEYINDSDKQIILLTTLHQSFSAYAKNNNLTREQEQEWEKVRGRFKDLTFNEPIEQLLFLASAFMQQHGLQKNTPDNLHKLNDALHKAHAITLSSDISQQLLHTLYPFDLLAACVLTLALQKYGQNERSLFSFLVNNDSYSLKNHSTETTPYYNVSSVYDYLHHNFYSFLHTKYNPHYAQWQAIQTAIERIEGSSGLDQHITEASQLIKTIGLLNIFASAGANLDDKFLATYAKYALGVKHATKLVEQLENKKIIRYKKYKKQYVPFEGTDVDIEAQLLEAATQVEQINDVVTPLNNYFNLPYIPAKAVQYQKGAARFFEFQLSDKAISFVPHEQIDGIVNLVFSEKLTSNEIVQFSAKQTDAILYGFFINLKPIKDALFELAKLDYLQKHHEIAEDKVALREIKSLATFEIEQINDLVLNSLFDDKGNVVWIYKGEILQLDSSTQFNKQLSIICNDVYHHTPVFKNEHVNRHAISTAISTARRSYFKQLINCWNMEDLGFDKDRFPPEKSIYLSLLKQTGIHAADEFGNYALRYPTDSSFAKLWDISETFLEQAKHNRKNLKEFDALLSKKPLKLKQVFVDFWLATFLFIKRNDFALFYEGQYIPVISIELIDLLYHEPAKFQIKAFNVSGVRLELFNRYRALIQKSTVESINQQSFVETIKPFLSFYKQLPPYTQNTKRLASATLRLRNAIANATDPEKTFFEDFPKALGYHDIEKLRNDEEMLQNYVDKLQDTIRELRTAQDELFNRIEAFICGQLGYEGQPFNQYIHQLQKRYAGLKKHLLLPHQQSFVNRLLFDNRNMWLNAVATSVINKSLESINDTDELILLEKLSDLFKELDNISDISAANVDTEHEEVIKLDFTTLTEGTKTFQIRWNKSKTEAAEKLKNKLLKNLSTDSNVNKVALIQLLKQLLQ
ncbi:MAG: hypothetical protein KA168_04170 [Chitinophagales bacterium]|nr:hypothetical protein [Chitinophagales bacterium]